MTDAEIEAHAVYADGAIDEVYTMAKRALVIGRSALLTAALALLVSGAVAAALVWH